MNRAEAQRILEGNANGDDGTFIYDLHERCEFNRLKFREYFDCLVQIANKSCNEPTLERTTSYMVSHTYNYIVGSLVSHYSPNDLFTIVNLPPYGELSEYLNDLRWVVDSYFQGKTVDTTFMSLYRGLH